MHNNLQFYVNNSLTVSACRVLIIKWVAAAWTEVKQKKEMVSSSFQKYWILIPINGSMDSTINTSEIEDYVVNYTGET